MTVSLLWEHLEQIWITKKVNFKQQLWVVLIQSMIKPSDRVI